jgi:citrate synthase
MVAFNIDGKKGNVMDKELKKIQDLIIKASVEAEKERHGTVSPAFVGRVEWPAECTVGPGLEGAIACETEIGYVNGTQGALYYRGYRIYDLCAYANYEQVAYLLLKGKLPTPKQLKAFTKRLNKNLLMPKVIRSLVGFDIEAMSPMASLNLATTVMKQYFDASIIDDKKQSKDVIGTDEDSMGMETLPFGEQKAVYEFEAAKKKKTDAEDKEKETFSACCHLISGLASCTAAISRVREGHMPIDPDENLSFAANYLYMMTGNKPTAVEEKIMDVALILHADHGMNASTFSSIVVASTLSDLYASIGAGIAALKGPLHGGANEAVLHMLDGIGEPENVAEWYKNATRKKEKVMGFGHRVYKTYDPRAKILGPLAHFMTDYANPESKKTLEIAKNLENEVVRTLGKTKGIYPNVDFYSGIVYKALGIPAEMFTPTFAVARCSGWTARVVEYLKQNRIFRPRAIYTGSLDRKYVPLENRTKK